MAQQGSPLADRGAMRIAAYELIQELQSGNADAAGLLEGLVDRAAAAGFDEVVRVGLFGQAIASWMQQDGGMAVALDALVQRSEHDGDVTMLALGLGLRASFTSIGTASADDDLVKAVVLLETAHGRPLEMISAHTACGIAFATRMLWELADEQYTAAFTFRDQAEPGIGDTLLGAVTFNRAEAQVDWAGKLRQVGNSSQLADRWEAWQKFAAMTRSFRLPQAWQSELNALGLLLAAITGEDVAADVDGALEEISGSADAVPRSVGHLKLALALSSVNAGRTDAVHAVVTAVSAIDTDVFPLMYDLALYVAAELEAVDGRSAGLLRAQREISSHWADRLTQVAAMRSRMEAHRLMPVLDRLSREANMDDLTGIANRRALGMYAAKLEQLQVDRVAVIILDIDGFKGVNDRYGHPIGDSVLVRVAAILSGSVRPTDLPVRIGGDEFLVALADTDIRMARQRADRLMKVFTDQRWSDVSPSLKVTVSMGVAGGPRSDFEAIRARADRAAYRAKHGGGHSIVVDGG
jgi:diguanylate cyclase (GGDEF)-like protein